MSSSIDFDPSSTLENQWGDTLAEELGETGQARKDLRRLARVLGLANLEACVTATRAAVAGGTPDTFRRDGGLRTPGGVFFRVARTWVRTRIGEVRASGGKGSTELETLYRALAVFKTGKEKAA